MQHSRERRFLRSLCHGRVRGNEALRRVQSADRPHHDRHGSAREDRPGTRLRPSRARSAVEGPRNLGLWKCRVRHRRCGKPHVLFGEALFAPQPGRKDREDFQPANTAALRNPGELVRSKPRATSLDRRSGVCSKLVARSLLPLPQRPASPRFIIPRSEELPRNAKAESRGAQGGRTVSAPHARSIWRGTAQTWPLQRAINKSWKNWSLESPQRAAMPLPFLWTLRKRIKSSP